MTLAAGIAQTAPIIHLAQTDSTNDELARRWRAQGRRPLIPFTALLADFQTHGRGRLGREWLAPAKTSVLASILVPIPNENATWVPLAAGLAVARVLRRSAGPTETNLGTARPEPATGLSRREVSLKWPNDVLIDGRKAAGILTERLGTADGRTWVALGVGINVSQTASQLPRDVPATSLALSQQTAADSYRGLTHRETNDEVSTAESPVSASWPTATALLDLVRQELRDLLPGDADSATSLHAKYQSECVSASQPVAVTLPDGSTIHGIGAGISPEGGLIVKGEDGGTRVVTAGDVTLVSSPPNSPGGLR